MNDAHNLVSIQLLRDMDDHVILLKPTETIMLILNRVADHTVKSHKKVANEFGKYLRSPPWTKGATK